MAFSAPPAKTILDRLFNIKPELSWRISMLPEAKTLIVHGPPGSAPPVMAEALRTAHSELHPDAPPLTLLPMGDDPGVDSMNVMAKRPGDIGFISTCTPVFIQAPLLRRYKLTHRQLTPIARLVSDKFYLVCRSEGPFSSASDFLAKIKSRKTTTGGYFLGGINHLLSLSIAKGTGADVAFEITPSEPAVWDALLAGDLDWACGVAAEVRGFVEAGKVRVLAALAEERQPAYPDCPTLGEAGLEVTFQLWRGLMAPGQLAPEAETAWALYFENLRKSAAWRRYLSQNGQSDAWLPGAAFKAFLEREWDWYETHLGLANLLPGKLG